MALIEGIGDEVTYAALLFTFFVLIMTIFFIKYYSTLTLQLNSSGSGNIVREHQSSHSSSPVDSTPSLSRPQSNISSRNSTSTIDQLRQNCDAPTSENVPNPPEYPVLNDESPLCTRTQGRTEPVFQDTPLTQNSPSFQSTNEGRTIPANVSSFSEGEQSIISSNTIKVRLKYLNDMERTVESQPTETIDLFRRTHFSDEITENKTVRLIYNGQLLRNGLTLQSCGIMDGTVVHVHISQVQTDIPTANHANADLDLSTFFWPLFTLILGVCWAFYIRHPEFFNVTSIVLLITLSVSFIAVYVHSQVHVQ